MKTDDIFIIELDFVNAFLVKINEEFILIDTGLPFHWQKLESKLTSAGCTPGKLKLIIITHGDIDHVGNCVKLQLLDYGLDAIGIINLASINNRRT